MSPSLETPPSRTFISTSSGISERSPESSLYYRPNVGIALFNLQGEVFLGRRPDIERKKIQKEYRKEETQIWQMPQGGIDAGETPEEAAIRELEEETGVTGKYIQKLGETEGWLYYDFPKSLIKKNKKYRRNTRYNQAQPEQEKVSDQNSSGSLETQRSSLGINRKPSVTNKKDRENPEPEYWIGQKQKWFAYRFLGENHHINIETASPEFDQWRWSSFKETPACVILWKKAVYEKVVSSFLPFSQPA